MRRELCISMSVLALTMSSIAVCWSIPFIQGDEQQYIVARDRELRLDNHRCVTMPPGTPYVQKACEQIGVLCNTMECRSGELLEPYSDCIPQSNAVCYSSERPIPVKVKITQEGECFWVPERRNCECKMKPLPKEQQYETVTFKFKCR
jgi:hypothetical protein